MKIKFVNTYKQNIFIIGPLFSWDVYDIEDIEDNEWLWTCGFALGFWHLFIGQIKKVETYED